MGDGDPNCGGHTEVRLASERRRSRRFACSVSAEGASSSPSLLFRGELTNLSETGCFVATRAQAQLYRDTLVEMRFSLLGNSFTLKALVVKMMPGSGIRLQFLQHHRRLSKILPLLEEHAE